MLTYSALLTTLRTSSLPQLSNKNNQQDARLLARSILASRVKPPLTLDAAVDALLAASGGLFVYLTRVADRLPGNITSVETLKALPTSLDALYLRFLEDQRDTLAASLAAHAPGKAKPGAPAGPLPSISDVLHVLVAAQEPPAVGDLCWLLKGASDDAVETVLASLESLSLFQKQVMKGKTCIVPTHKSVSDFLCDKARSGDNYVDTAAAHARLAAVCIEQLKQASGAKDAIAETYAARFAATHAKQAGDAAEALLKQVPEALAKALGPTHARTLTATVDYAVVVENKGRRKDAEALYRQVLKDRSETLGPEAPETIASVRNVAICLYGQVCMLYNEIMRCMWTFNKQERWPASLQT